ncbi:MAG TPA: vWA domain-containing protein [Gemmataceae bacterium]|nr:vWA domain-containing protein [Gemmataceae bacterium]
MPYSAPINRANPTALVFLLDQSSSMLEPFGAQPEKSKAEGVSDALNRLLQNLVLKCAKADGVRDFFHIGMVSYGGPVASAFRGSLAGGALVPVSRIANSPLRVEVRTRKASDGAGGVIEQQFKFPVWFEARPGGRTPMCGALRLAQEYLRDFLRTYPSCYPPIVVNITDGQPTDGDPHEPAAELRALASQDGNVLLFNAHLSDKQNRPIEYPSHEAELPDKFARQLFQISSQLPPKLAQMAKAEGFAVGPLSRGFVFNADLLAVVRFLDIGTKVAQKGN